MINQNPPAYDAEEMVEFVKLALGMAFAYRKMIEQDKESAHSFE